MSKVPIEKLGAGDIVRIFHFIGARRKKHYMYRLITIEAGVVYAVDISQIATMGFSEAFRTRVETLRGSEFDVIYEAEELVK